MPDNPVLAFADTNVLVYAHDTSAGVKNTRAKELIERLQDTHTGVLSVQVLQEFYVVSTQKVSRPLGRQTASDLISNLAEWTVHSPEAKDILRAVDLQVRLNPSFWDAMIVNSALATIL